VVSTALAATARTTAAAGLRQGLLLTLVTRLGCGRNPPVFGRGLSAYSRRPVRPAVGLARFDGNASCRASYALLVLLVASTRSGAEGLQLRRQGFLSRASTASRSGGTEIGLMP
jgi:hypothetical protein